MMKCAIRSGIAGFFPTLNYRENGALEQVINNLNAYKKNYGSGNFGVNLIVQKTNVFYEKHLEICVREKIPAYITSLGNPQPVIEAAQKYGAKVFCDVTNIEHAKKSADRGCDGFIAVGQGAGGHAGPFPLSLLIESLKKNFPDKVIIAAGGIATGTAIVSALASGAAGVSIGTLFIATDEAGVKTEYKNAVVNAGMNDIVMTERISGTPCNIINTPFAKKIGYSQNWFEKILNSNPHTKKYFKMLVQYKGMKKLEEAVKPGNYNNLWCAGQSVEMVNAIRPCDKIIAQLINEMAASKKQLDKMFT